LAIRAAQKYPPHYLHSAIILNNPRAISHGADIKNGKSCVIEAKQIIVLISAVVGPALDQQALDISSTTSTRPVWNGN